MTEEKLYTMQEASKFLEVPYITLRQYVSAGIIPFLKPKGRYYFRHEELVEFKKGNIKVSKK